MTPSERPTLDIVIPVHSASRPIERAVRSVIGEGIEGVGAIVVCHNIVEEEIAVRLGELATDPRVRLFELRDGIPSPAGPLNEGVRRSASEYVGFLGSDDELSPGALAAWLDELRDRPSVLIGQLVTELGGRILAPAPRPGRCEDLDPVLDLLNLRAAPVGVLVQRTVLLDQRSPGFRAGFRTGEDIALGLYLWNCTGRIRYSRCPVGYYGHETGGDRVTGQRFAPDEIAAPILEALELPVLRELPRRRRQAIGVKLARHHVLYWLRASQTSGMLDDQLMRAAGAMMERIVSFAPGVLGFFPVSETRVFRALGGPDLSRLVTALGAAERTNYRWKLIPRNPLRLFAPETFMMFARRTRASAQQFPAPETPARAEGGRHD